jgi:hypothetical protein
MSFKSIVLSATILVLSINVSAATLVEDFSDPFPQWESDWLGINSNIQNVYGAGSTTGADFLWITDGDGITGLGEAVQINFNATFGASLTSFSMDIDTNVDTSIEIYDASGSTLLSSDLVTTGSYQNVYVVSSNGISGFSLSSSSQIEGNTAIDNVIVNTSVVPVPAAVWLFGSGLIGLIGIARRKKA